MVGFAERTASSESLFNVARGELDETVGDHDVKVHDAIGRPITDPVYIILGHELIHARHIGAGTVDPRPLPKAGPNILKEDEITIATGDLTENDLRSCQATV